MDVATSMPEAISTGFNWKLIVLGILIGGVICTIVYFVIRRRNTTPNGPEGFVGAQQKDQKKKEGFGGAMNGVGLQSLPEAAALLGLFEEKGARSADFAELAVLMKKLAAFQKDILAPAHIVDATRGLPFATSHDREPVADTAARCFNKTIPQRDLEISLDTWKERGETLVKRLAVETDLKSSDMENAKDLFGRAWNSVRNAARGACLSGEPTIVGEPQPRQPSEYTPMGLYDYGEYKDAPW